MKHSLLSNKAARIAVFALAAGSSIFSYAQSAETPAAAEETYSTLTQKIDTLAAQKNLLNMKQLSQNGYPTPENAASIRELKASIASGSTNIAPAIVLTPGISEDDTKKLIQRYSNKIGDAPDYLTAVAKDTASLHLCQELHLTPETAKTAAAAQTISDCAASHVQMPQTSAPAPSLAVQDKTPKTNFSPAVAQPEMTSTKKIALPFGMSMPVAAGAGAGTLALIFLGVALAMRGRGNKPETESAATVEPSKNPVPPVISTPPEKPKDKKDDFSL